MRPGAKGSWCIKGHLFWASHSHRPWNVVLRHLLAFDKGVDLLSSARKHIIPFCNLSLFTVLRDSKKEAVGLGASAPSITDHKIQPVSLVFASGIRQQLQNTSQRTTEEQGAGGDVWNWGGMDFVFS